MAGTKKFGEENYIANPMGIPAYDYISNTYDVSDNLTQVVYIGWFKWYYRCHNSDDL